MALATLASIVAQYKQISSAKQLLKQTWRQHGRGLGGCLSLALAWPRDVSSWSTSGVVLEHISVLVSGKTGSSFRAPGLLRVLQVGKMKSFTSEACSWSKLQCYCRRTRCNSGSFYVPSIV